MIVRTTVDGRPAAVAYIKQDFTPCSKEQAELVRVHWDDGDTAFLVPQKPAYDQILKYNKCHDPETGKFCSTGGTAVLRKLRLANQWLLDRQSREGTEAAIVFDSSGNDVFIQEGTQNHVPLSPEQLNQLRGLYLTHNHPGVSFPGLSAADLFLASYNELAEIFSCTEAGSLIGASVNPRYFQEIERAELSATSLSTNILTERLKASYGTNWAQKLEENREVVKAAQSILSNYILNDIGLINLTVYNQGAVLQKANDFFGGIDTLRTQVKHKIVDWVDVDDSPSPNDAVEFHSWKLAQAIEYVRRVSSAD